MVVHFTIKYGFPDYFVQRGILLSITLVIVWLKMFKYCRVLKTLGEWVYFFNFVLYFVLCLRYFADITG